MKGYLFGLAGLGLGIMGCVAPQTSADECPRGETVTTSQGVVCVYHGEIVIETGFSCPADFPHAHPTDGAVVCSKDRELSDQAMNEALVDVPGVSWPVGGTPPGPPGPEPGEPGVTVPIPTTPGTGLVDILWVIDNSGSMCRKQAHLRDNFGAFIDSLRDLDLDFHLGVTTTHMETGGEYPFEPVAQPGHLQSRPQPVPGFDPSCYYNLDASGDLDPEAGVEPVLETIRIAVSCTRDPSQYQALLTPNLNDLRCALDQGRWNCTFPIPPREDFFPPPGAYREIPRVLKASDYADGAGALDLDRLKADFACMSLVGTRGYGYEKGLLAGVAALSPELNEPGGPNDGFLRPDAHTGIIFISDENDCSHDGNLNERSSCGVAQCTFDENDGVNLIPVETLKQSLLDNLSASKGMAISEDQVIMASIHGRYQRYTEPRPATCDQGFAIPPSCSSELGKAYSGHRYDAFIRQFSTYFPSPPQADPNGPLPGLVCSDFSDALTGLGNIFQNAASGD